MKSYDLSGTCFVEIAEESINLRGRGDHEGRLFIMLTKAEARRLMKVLQDEFAPKSKSKKKATK